MVLYVSKRLNHNVCLTTSFSNIFLITFFSQRLSHNVFLKTQFLQILSRNVILTTAFSQRLFHNAFLTTLSHNVVITLFDYIFVLTTLSSQHYDSRGSLSVLYVQTAVISTRLYLSNSTSSRLMTSIIAAILIIFGRSTLYHDETQLQ